MKKILSLIAFFGFTLVANAQTWNVDKSHSNVSFSVTHMMLSDVDGNFTAYDAKVVAAKEDLSDAVFEMTAQVSSVNTNNERRDNHLKSADFFDAEKFPTVSFKSTSFKKVEGKKYKMAGNLTMHGVTKPVTLDVTLNGPVVNPRNQKKMIGIKAVGTINRTHFGVSTMPSAAVSEEIEIRAAGEFTLE